MRYLGSALIGAVAGALLFLLMQHLAVFKGEKGSKIKSPDVTVTIMPPHRTPPKPVDPPRPKREKPKPPDDPENKPPGPAHQRLPVDPPPVPNNHGTPVPPVDHHVAVQTREWGPDGTAGGGDGEWGASAVVTIAPMYPTRAARDGAEGEATIEFTVTARGEVQDARVVAEEPKGYGFGRAALRSVQRSTYRPQSVDGRPVDGRVTQTITFKLENTE